MGKGHRRCEICGIKEAWQTGTKFLFSKFPLDLNRCREWLKVVGNEELVHLPIEKLHEQRNVCANHFEKKDFNIKGNRLKRHAIPTLDLKALPLTDAQLAEFPQYMYKHSELKDDDESSRSAPDATVEENQAVIDYAPNYIPDDAPMPTAEASAPIQEDSTCPELDPEPLIALGEETDITPKFGDKIHHSLAQRWEPILKKGLSKKTKDKLLKDYLVPENCTLLQAPKLNNEVSAAISEASRRRDKRKEAEQQQLDVGVSAISKALTVMLTSDNKTEAIKILSDGCRILSDLHYQETQSRISAIDNDLAKPFLNVVPDSERDETLYGKKLGDKNKRDPKQSRSKNVSNKKAPKGQKGTSVMEPTTSNSRPQYQYHGANIKINTDNQVPTRETGQTPRGSNRTGRRGLNRANSTTTRRPPPHQQSNSVAANKSRAPVTRQ